jgi:hypothetical protein
VLLGESSTERILLSDIRLVEKRWLIKIQRQDLQTLRSQKYLRGMGSWVSDQSKDQGGITDDT